MKRLFYVLLIFIGVLVMFKPINSIIKDSIGNIMFRGNVVTGIIATDKGDGSYDVFISESDRAYPKIFTLSRNPNLAVGDKVRILYKNGCKELPIILPPVKASAVDYIFVIYQTGGNYYLNRYTYDGVLSSELGILSEITSGTIYRINVDSNQNIYIFNYNYPTMKVYKYDKNGNYLLVKTVEGKEYYSCISPNGYLYTLSGDVKNRIRERNLSDLEINQTYYLTAGHDYYYLTFDSDSYAYLYDTDYPTKGYVKWIIGTGLVSRHYQTNNSSSLDSWVVAGDYIGCAYFNPYTIAKALNSDRVAWTLDDISTLYKMTSTPDYFICLGIDSGGKLIIEKYTPERVKQWKTEVATSFTDNRQYCGIGAYPF